MTRNAGPILLITNKGRTIRKLIRRGKEVQKNSRPREWKKKNHARQSTLKNNHTTAKKDSYKEFDNEKKNDYAFFIFWREYRIKALMHIYMHTHVHIYWLVPQGFSESMLQLYY